MSHILNNALESVPSNTCVTCRSWLKQKCMMARQTDGQQQLPYALAQPLLD